MQEYTRLRVPAFDLTWIQLLPDTEPSHVVLAGGGGSAKSGVKNQLVVMQQDSVSGSFLNTQSLETDTPTKSVLCSGVASGFLNGEAVVSALLGEQCLLLSVGQSKDGPLTFTRKVEFVADRAKDDACVHCCAIKYDCVATGGEDGFCRIWKVDTDNEMGWRSKTHHEIKGHGISISALAFHPRNRFICVAYKDGVCKLFGLDEGNLMGELRDPNINEALKIECRGCCFSPCGSFLFSLESMKKGSSRLKKWRLCTSNESVKSKAVSPVTIYLEHSVVVCNVPCIRLSMSSTGDLLAVGDASGRVSLYRSSSLALQASFPCHDFVVTGVGFAPLSTSERFGLRALIVSCSADNNFVVMKYTGDMSPVLKIALFLLLLVVVYVLASRTHLLLGYLP